MQFDDQFHLKSIKQQRITWFSKTKILTRFTAGPTILTRPNSPVEVMVAPIFSRERLVIGSRRPSRLWIFSNAILSSTMQLQMSPSCFTSSFVDVPWQHCGDPLQDPLWPKRYGEWNWMAQTVEILTTFVWEVRGSLRDRDGQLSSEQLRRFQSSQQEWIKSR